ncbi:MAG: succinate dehydrogenase, hydrophobic membrane anchor protein [Steroidobacteraceae bacterium]
MRGATPLARVLGFGSAKQGAHHWWIERVTAVALVPLGIWLVISLFALPDLGHATVARWIGEGIHPTLLLLTLLTMTWHSRLGVQVVVEDYVHGPALKSVTIMGLAFIHAAIAVAGSIAILRLAFAA